MNRLALPYIRRVGLAHHEAKLDQVTWWARPTLRLCFALAVLSSLPAIADEKSPTEADYYPITRFEVPKGVELEAAGFQLMPDGRMAVCSRRGEIWMIANPFAKEVKADQFKRFAHGLHESLS